VPSQTDYDYQLITVAKWLFNIYKKLFKTASF
jgi:hypothetical protein